MTQRARRDFLGCELCENCDHPVCCRARPVTTLFPCVTPATSQVKHSLHDFADPLCPPPGVNPTGVSDQDQIRRFSESDESHSMPSFIMSRARHGYPTTLTMIALGLRLATHRSKAPKGARTP